MSTHAALWTEELQLSRHLHGLLNHAQFKPLISYLLLKRRKKRKRKRRKEKKRE
jgi:hypothetical protein